MMKHAWNISTTTGRKAITAALDDMQTLCTARTITLDDMVRICETVTRRLDIPKTALAGTAIWYTGAEHFARAYRYIPMCTMFRAEYNGRAWIITDIDREICPNRQDNVTVTLSDSAKAALLKQAASMSI